MKMSLVHNGIRFNTAMGMRFYCVRLLHIASPAYDHKNILYLGRKSLICNIRQYIKKYIQNFYAIVCILSVFSRLYECACILLRQVF